MKGRGYGIDIVSGLPVPPLASIGNQSFRISDIGLIWIHFPLSFALGYSCFFWMAKGGKRMNERLKYRRRLLDATEKYSIRSSRMKDMAFIQISSLEKRCSEKGITQALLFAEMDGGEVSKETETGDVVTTLSLPQIMSTLDSYMAEKGISKREMSRRAGLTRGNYQKLYKTGRSINLDTFFRFLEIIETKPSDFLKRCMPDDSGEL